MKDNPESKVKDHIDRLEVLSEIYNDLSKIQYPKREEKELARLKMELIKKEMLLLNYLIEKDIETISSG